MKLEDGVIPIEHECERCGKIYEEGCVKAIMWPLQKGWLCPECRSKLGVTTEWKTKHTTLTLTTYEGTRFKMWSGNCSLCNCFPCQHVEQDDKGNWRLTYQRLVEKRESEK